MPAEPAIQLRSHIGIQLEAIIAGACQVRIERKTLRERCAFGKLLVELLPEKAFPAVLYVFWDEGEGRRRGGVRQLVRPKGIPVVGGAAKDIKRRVGCFDDVIPQAAAKN